MTQPPYPWLGATACGVGLGLIGQLVVRLLVAAGVLYRLDTYLFAFMPGQGWTYFPSIGEILITFGLVATETMAYLVIVKKFPVLGGAPAR